MKRGIRGKRGSYKEAKSIQRKKLAETERVLELMQKDCLSCGERFYPSRSGQKYCSYCQGGYHRKQKGTAN